MTWLRRICWLAASGVWLWLGFGLYRELPRNVGPAVCQIPVAPYQTHSMRIAGFDGLNRVVVLELGENAPKTVSVYDAETAERIARFNAPNVEWRWSWRDSKLNHGRFIVNDRQLGGLKSLNLADGIWCTINPQGALGFAVHPTQPLVAFIHAPTDPSQRKLSVFDLSALRLTFDLSRLG